MIVVISLHEMALPTPYSKFLRDKGIFIKIETK